MESSEKAKIIKEFSRGDNDCGSPEVQIALQTANIKKLSDHMMKNKKDLHSKRGMMGMISRRRRLLNYLQKEDVERYRALISRLQLRK